MRPELRYPAAAMAAGAARLREWGRFFTRPAALPLVLLLLALSTVFLFGHDRAYFYRDGLHNWNTAAYTTVAANLSLEHNLLLFGGRGLDADGNPVYWPYSRFPIGGYALLKLAIWPFGEDFSAQIYAGRIMFLAFFAGSATLAYLSLCRLTANQWIALTATLLAFSSFYLLYYNDMPATETGLSLFGVMLTFHGMVIFVQEGRFRQLLLKTCAALLLGWHVYALLLPFIIFGLVRDLRKAPGGISPPHSTLSRLAKQIGCRGRALLTSSYLRLGAAALVFGIAVLSFNLGNEYFALGREVPPDKLPTVNSMRYRFGASAAFNARHAEYLEWGRFMKNQFFRIGRATLPYMASPFERPHRYRDREYNYDTGDYMGVVVGALALGICLVGLIFARHKMLMATLALAGFCWALPMRHNTARHDFESVFYVGIPLAAFAFTMLYIRKLSGDHIIYISAVIAVLVFALSSAKMAEVGHSEGAAIAQREMMQDFTAIRHIAGAGSVHIPPHQDIPENERILSYFLAGSVIAGSVEKNLADFIILSHRDAGPALLTPQNSRIFLYDRALYDGQYDEKTLGRPIIASDWNVYFRSGLLIYTSEECSNTDAAFFLHIVPRYANDLPEQRKQYGFDNRDFLFADLARISGERCVAVRELPPYDFIAVRTGQYTAEGPIWEGETHFER